MLRGKCITSPNGEQMGFPGTTGDESSQQYTSVLRAVSYGEVGSGLHRMRQPETSWHTCQRGGQDKEPPHVVNYSATHRKPELVRRSANRQAAWAESRRTRQRGRGPGITMGDSTPSVKNHITHRRPWVDRASLPNNRAAGTRGGVRANGLKSSRGVHRALVASVQRPASQGDQ
jgi:hypothetical protein